MDISRRREAWLTLFSCDDPDTVIQLIEKYPEFRKIYEEGYQICLNMERVMGMFSKELYEMDKNMVQYMVDVMQETINSQKKELKELEAAGKRQKKECEEALREREKAQAECEKAQAEREKALRGTLKIFQNLNMPENDIIQKICELYELTEEQARAYLAK